MKTRLLVPLILGLAVVLVGLASKVSSSPLVAEPLESSRAGALTFLGAGSCAATACHGRPGATGIVGSEYSTWVARDKHARAYEALFQPRSARMMEALDSKTKAHENVLCLSCHVLPESKWVNSQVPELFRNDGVSCESCHGPARQWVSQHRQVGWKEKSAEEKLALGMWDTKSLPARIKLCVDCHVGSLGSEVNHDLIAAGHPRLNFEFSAFHASMPRHWPDRHDKVPALGGHADFETRGWVLGQIQSAQAALNLLQERNESKAGMELSDRDCYACHHDLQGKSRRQAAGRLGSIPWNSWYFTQLPRALAAAGNQQDAELLNILDKIRQKKANPGDAKKVAELLHIPGDLKVLDASALFQEVLAGDINKTATSWDDAAQVYLTLAAVHNTWTDQKNLAPAAKLRPILVDWRDSIRFPGGKDSPKTFDPDAIRLRLKSFR